VEFSFNAAERTLLRQVYNWTGTRLDYDVHIVDVDNNGPTFDADLPGQCAGIGKSVERGIRPTESGFNIQLDTNSVISETFPQANLSARRGRKAKPNTTEARVHQSKEMYCSHEINTNKYQL